VVAWAVATFALVAGGTSYVLGRGGDEPPSPPPLATGSTTAPPGSDSTADTTADNLAATRAMSAWLLHAIPMPDGAVESDRSPAPVIGEPGLGMCPSDRALRLTTWWTVPLAEGDFLDWVAAHLPAGLHIDDGTGRSGTVLSFSVSGSGTAAYTTPTIALDYVDLDGQTAVRIDTFISARFGRDIFVPGSTSDVTLRLTRHEAGRPHGHTTSRHLTAPGAVARLVASANGVPGASTAECVHSCPPFLEKRDYTLRFVGPGDSYALRATDFGCGSGARLDHDGTRVAPVLDPPPAFFRQLDRLLRRP
jgi:hypothetical protein